jgi:hypothetical protein
VKVTAFDGSGEKIAVDRSNGTFQIEVIRLLSPDGGESFSGTTMETISWRTNTTSKKVKKTNLFYSLNGSDNWKRIVTLDGDPGSHDWVLPEVAKVKDNCRVKVIQKDRSGRTLGRDVSNRPFTINP